MAKQLTISLPDKHFDTFMGLFKQFKVKVQLTEKKSNLSKNQKKTLDERLSNYLNNPDDVTEWDTFMKEIK